MSGASLPQIAEDVVSCTACPDLRAYCRTVAAEKRRAWRDWTYWGRPVPGFGDPRARLALVGLAPAAHGANRTGRMFTGDRSGDFLYAGLHRAGFANQAEATHREDGLRLTDIWITAAVRCAPPANRPTAAHQAACRPYLRRELEALRPRVIIALGGLAWNAVLRTAPDLGLRVPRPRPRFGHGRRLDLGGPLLLGCYHVSQQNTFTGRLTPSMLDDVLTAARARLDRDPELP